MRKTHNIDIETVYNNTVSYPSVRRDNFVLMRIYWYDEIHKLYGLIRVPLSALLIFNSSK